MFLFIGRIGQVFPQLNNSGGGAIITVADGFLDLTGPANQLTAQLTHEFSNMIIRQIQEIEPDYYYPTFGFLSNFHVSRLWVLTSMAACEKIYMICTIFVEYQSNPVSKFALWAVNMQPPVKIAHIEYRTQESVGWRLTSLLRVRP